jgi:hypothetical protein
VAYYAIPCPGDAVDATKAFPLPVDRGRWLRLAAVVVGIAAALLPGLTVEFVVPVMVHERRGLVAGWRRFRPALRAILGQVAV